ncbi:MAG: TIGR03668 family PPOX class F420-dependent oxidoreductase [Candidatus Binatia bacterium]
MKSPLDAAARDFLERQRAGRLATADREARPHVIPFVYALVGDSIYFVVDEKPKASGKVLKRVRNILENPRVAMVVDVYDEDWSRLEYVMVRGSAALVADEEEFRRVLARLRERYPQYREMRLEPGRNPLVRITPDAVNHWKASA